MNSLLKRYDYKAGDTESHITITGERTANDVNGNPVWMLQLWSGHDTVWHPKLVGYRQRKDNRYRVQGYDLQEEMDLLAEVIITQIKNYHI